MNIGQKQTWWMDAALFAGLIVAFFMDLTGVVAHQWIGIFAGALAVIHLVTHWNWVKAVNKRFFGRTSGQARLYYLIDAAIFIGFVSMVGTGLVISTWLGLSLTNASAWVAVHIIASIATLSVVSLKLGFHWRWIAVTGKKALPQPVPTYNNTAPVRQATGGRQVSRRQFLEVMGVTGVAALVAISTAVQSLQSLEGVETTAVALAADTNSAVTSDAASANAAVSSACVVRCNRGCSYPGHCRRYTDSNSNNLCDFGECL